jgi:F-type H+-transporting ATPase subunit b
MTGSLVGIDMNMVFQLVNTLVLYLLLRHFLFKPVSDHLASRRDRIENDLRSAEDAKKEAERLKSEYQGKLDGVEKEAGEIISGAARSGEMRRCEIIRDAKAEAKNIFKRAQRDIMLEKEKAMSGIRDEMVSISMQAAEKVLEENIDSETNRRLIRDYVDGVGRIS